MKKLIILAFALVPLHAVENELFSLRKQVHSFVVNNYDLIKKYELDCVEAHILTM